MSALSPRPYAIEEYTRSVCPRCFEEGPVAANDDAFVDAMLTSRDGSIWLRRWCPKHGETESLYEESADIWRARAGWQTPTLAMMPDRADNHGGFPGGYRDGLPSSHGQHTCILVLNVTERCNLSCPTCYASALPPATPGKENHPSQAEILSTVNTVIQREGGRLGVVMLSGGEPTIRKDLPELIERLCELPVTRIMINTNGRRIARDDAFLKVLETHKERVEAYLQFDGFEEATYMALRGENLAAEKIEALDRLGQAGIFTTLVTTVKRGVNEHELGAIFHEAIQRPRVSGWAVQPVFGSGRGTGIDGANRATPTGVIQKLQEQSKEQIKASDFIPLPCSHKDCCDIAYLIRDKQDRWRSLIDLVGREELKRWIHLASNTISFEHTGQVIKQMVKEGVLQRVFSEQQPASSLQVAADLFRMCDCIPGLPDLVYGVWDKVRGKQKPFEGLAERTLRVTVKMFMDSHTLHEARIRQCCVHVGTFEEDPRRYSFCWRWMFADSSDFPARTFANTIPLAVR